MTYDKHSHLNILYQRPESLITNPRNPRVHSDKQVDQLVSCMKRNGFTNPILVDASNKVIAGHGRILAAKKLGFETVPTICLAHMSEADIRAYVIADNKIAENAAWDRQLLALEFEYLSTLNLDFDLCITGFELPEIDILLNEAKAANQPAPKAFDEVPELPAAAVTRLGDVWIIGQHRLICGDSTKPESFERLMGQQRAQMVFCDAPYNVPINGHVGGLGKIKHPEFVMASGEMNSSEFTNFLTTVTKLLAMYSVDGSIHFHCMDHRHIREILDACEAAYTEMKNLCVWVKASGGMGSLYRSRHELVFVFKSGTAKHINNVELGKHGRYRTNVWEYAGVNSFGSNREDLALHPTVKPTQMIADAMLDCSHRNGIVLDAFAGSGTTLVAAQQTGRRGYGIEIDPRYCDVIIQRMKRLHQLDATLESTQQTFEQVASERSIESAAEDA